MGYYKVPTTTKVISMLNQRGRLEKVIDLVSTLPSNPNQGDRYIDLNDNKVKEYDGSTWQEYTPNQGDNLYVLNRDRYYYFNGSEWADLVSTASLWEQTGDTLTPKTADNIQINGSFIGDGSQLTGIKKLIADFVAQGNVTAGDVVAFVNGKVRKGKVVSGNDVENQGNEYEVTDHNTSITVVVCRLTDSKFVIVYKDNTDGKGKAIIGEINGNQITFGNEYIFSLPTVFSVSRLTDYKFVIASASASIGKAIIGEVNGNQITFGNEYEFTYDFPLYISVSTLLENKFIICYEAENDNYRGKAIIGEVNGNQITFGNEYIFNDTNNNSSTTWISVSALSYNKFVVIYRDQDNTNYGFAIIGEVNGNQITFGNKFSFDNAPYRMMVSCLTDSKFVIVFNSADTNNFLAIIGEVNNFDISFGNKFIIDPNLTIYVFVDKFSASKFVVVYRDSDNRGKAIIGEVNGNQITFGNEYEFTSVNSFHNSVSCVTSSKFVIGYYDYDNQIIYSTICELSSGESLQYIGIAQETKNDGETVKVLIQGISPVHNSLTVGQKYYATEGGDLTDQETADYLGIAISPTELLLLDWQRPKTIYDETEDVFYMPT